LDSLFPQYASLIAQLPDRKLTKADLCIPEFRLHREHLREGTLEIYYAPFDAINPYAKILLVGITPGWYHMEIAFRTASLALRGGWSLEHACAYGKQQAIFAGSMRRTLAEMLDGLGVNSLLAIPSTALLFTDRYDLLHASGSVRYPVFVNGENYTGYKPPLLTTPALRHYVDHELAADLQQVSQALIIPLGRSVNAAVQTLVAQGLIDPARCLFGLPHPSGANAHRKGQYEVVKETLRGKVEAWFMQNA